jgi:hypothetical protein
MNNPGTGIIISAAILFIVVLTGWLLDRKSR